LYHRKILTLVLLPLNRNNRTKARTSGVTIGSIAGGPFVRREPFVGELRVGVVVQHILKACRRTIQEAFPGGNMMSLIGRNCMEKIIEDKVVLVGDRTCATVEDKTNIGSMQR
jgi:hypothetical protein